MVFRQENMKMNYRIGHVTTAGKAQQPTRDATLLNAIVPGVDYDALAQQVVEQYSAGGQAQFEALLAIPHAERIPSLSAEYGVNQMKQLMTLMLTHYFYSLPLLEAIPSKPSIRSAVAKIYSLAQSHFFSLEDLIVVLERARQTHIDEPSCKTAAGIALLFREYCMLRHKAYEKIMLAKEEGLKQLGPLMRVAPEPTPIDSLIPGALIIDMTKKMSG